MVLGVFFRGCLSVFLVISENSGFVKNGTTPARQLDLQGLAGFVSVSFLLFFGFGFWMGLGMDF